MGCGPYRIDASLFLGFCKTKRKTSLSVVSVSLFCFALSLNQSVIVEDEQIRPASRSQEVITHYLFLLFIIGFLSCIIFTVVSPLFFSRLLNI